MALSRLIWCSSPSTRAHGATLTTGAPLRLRKVWGPVRYHCRATLTARTNVNPWDYLAESDGVDASAALQGDPTVMRVGIDGGRPNWHVGSQKGP